MATRPDVKTIYRAGVDTCYLFTIERGGDTYFAVRNTGPRFALAGASVADVAAQAERALALSPPRDLNIISRDEWNALLAEQKLLEANTKRYRLPTQRAAWRRAQEALTEHNRKIRAVDGVIGIDA